MGRKRKQRKSRPEGGEYTSTTGVSVSDHSQDSAGPKEAIRWNAAENASGHSAQEREPQGRAERVAQVANKQSESGQRTISGSGGERPPSNPPASGGLFSKISKWWRGPSPVTVRVPSNPPGGYAQQKIPTPPPAAQKEAPIISAKISEPPVSGPTSAVEKVHAVLMLERIMPELEETKRQLQSERESNQAKIRDLEKSRDRLRDELDQLRNNQGESAGHTNVLRKSVAALERQLQEERDAAAKSADDYEARIRAFEESIRNSRTPVAQLRAELEEAQTERDRMESLLNRYREEMETAQRQLREQQAAPLPQVDPGAADAEIGKFQERIRQLEVELADAASAVAAGRSERERVAEQARSVQTALDTMEQQLRSERESFVQKSKELETELADSRRRSKELASRVSALEAQLDKTKGRGRKKGAPEPEPEEITSFTSGTEQRVQLLEQEFATPTSPAPLDKQTAQNRISRLESRWEDLKGRLLPKDREITELRQQKEQLRFQIDQLEEALAEARAEAEAAASTATQPNEEEESEDGKAASVSGLNALSPEAVAALYNQSMSKLTVLMASADIVLMNPKLEQKLRGSIQDIKTESQSLLDLIKSYAIPPDAAKGH
jgi:DNA repair exonuclease SbcCD ATPase subunit